MRKRSSSLQPKFLTVPESAEFCGVSRNTLYIWVREGRLPAYQTPGRTNLIRPSELLKFMQNSGMYVPHLLADLARRDHRMELSDYSMQKVKYVKRDAVLVVDDDIFTRNLLVRSIKNISKVCQAETGYEALHLLTLYDEIKTVLLDLRMPGQHGLDTLSEIKAKRFDLKIIVITGFPEDVSRDLIHDGTVERVIEKPFNVNMLKDTVKALQSRRRAAV